ncbi:hypothetical protein ACHHYP_15432 [Achlya hypogyna]|uniref:FYVE-type domain-containing protein n=1 Tax=Achlya hypogyna TaxID=1202772 RepID=A0A1V9ZEV9_ACHHY|nr:hypothetical protein ACHHYP_15432 [Achlya hypogyna]
MSEPFHCPPLSRYEKEQLIEQAHVACKLTVRNATQFATEHELDCILHNDKTDQRATIYKGFDTDDGLPEAGMCAHTRVTASLEQVADLFYLDNTAKYDAYSRITGQLVKKKVSLYTLVERHDTLHYIGVEWMVAKTPIGLKDRDFCFIEVHDEFVFVDRASQETRRGWVRCLHSIALDCCPPLDKSHAIVRSQFVRSGHVFMETNRPGVLEYYNLLCGVTRRPGFTPMVAQEFVLRRHVSQILNLDEHFITLRLKQLLETPSSSFPARDHAEYCAACYHKFTWLSVKRQCRGCGDVLCTRCCFKWEVPLTETVIAMTICRHCAHGDRARPSSLPPSPQSSRFRLDDVHRVEGHYTSVIVEELEALPSPLGLHHFTFKGEEDDLALALGAVSPLDAPPELSMRLVHL